MLENFGLHESLEMKKALTEGLDAQWRKPLSRAGAAMGTAKSAADAVPEFVSSADSAAKAMNGDRPAFPNRRMLRNDLY